jgi:4-coumarate--CoA ligase
VEDSPFGTAKEDTVLHVDAANPTLFLTKAQLRKLVQRFAHTFCNRFGVQNGKVVTVFTGGSYLVSALFYGVIASGGIYSTVNSSYTAQELARVMQLSNSDIIVCNMLSKDNARRAAEMIGIDRDRVLLLDDDSGTMVSLNGQDVVGTEGMDWERIVGKARLERRVLCLIYSSGTTGLPKGV